MNYSDGAGFYIGNTVFLGAEAPKNVHGFLTEEEWAVVENLPYPSIVQTENNLIKQMGLFGTPKKIVERTLESLEAKGLISRGAEIMLTAPLWRWGGGQLETTYIVGEGAFRYPGNQAPHQLANLRFFYDPGFDSKPRLFDKDLLENIKELSMKEERTEEETASMLNNDDFLVWELFDYLSNIQFKRRMKRAPWLTPDQIDLAYKFLIVKKVPLPMVAKGFGLSQRGLLSLIKRTVNIVGGLHGRGLPN